MTVQYDAASLGDFKPITAGRSKVPTRYGIGIQRRVSGDLASPVSTPTAIYVLQLAAAGDPNDPENGYRAGRQTLQADCESDS